MKKARGQRAQGGGGPYQIGIDGWSVNSINVDRVETVDVITGNQYALNDTLEFNLQVKRRNENGVSIGANANDTDHFAPTTMKVEEII